MMLLGLYCLGNVDVKEIESREDKNITERDHNKVSTTTTTNQIF